MWVPVLLPLLGPLIFLPVFSLSLLQTLLSLFLSAITEPLHYTYPPPQYTAPFFSHYRAPYSLSSLLSAKPPHHSSLLHLPFQLIYATTHSIIRMGSLKVVDLERELAYLWLDEQQGGYNLHDDNNNFQVIYLSQTH